jgi:predicted ATPase/class 3 adenylate cyclase/uncharacterized protein HemY
MTDLPTGTITLLFTDMEGSTRLLQQVGQRYADILKECRYVLRTAFEQWHGQEMGTEGDSFFVVFARASDALHAAVDIQRSLAAHSWPLNAQVRVRIGVHTGEPTLTSEGYVGLDVHHAARIMSAAHGGQILLSPTTWQLVKQNLPEGTYVQDLGQHRLKDLQRPDHLFQVSVENLLADFPPLKTLDASANNLPMQPTPFIGREREVTTVTQLLRQPEVHLVTLTGAGGVGKTRLGLQVAAELSDQFTDGVWLVALAPVSDAEQVVPTIMSTLLIKEAGGQPLLGQLKAALKDKQMLLVLDNFEQVVDAALQIAELLAACPKLKILVTSRVVLHVQAEREFAVPPLSLPNPKRLPDLVTLSQYEAVALFIQRAQAVKPDFQVTNANAPAVAGICARLDGLPLAIELAAARVKYFAPQALFTRLEQGLSVLTGGARDLPARQQTLRGAIAWSYDLLSPEEKALFRRLAVFVDGWTIETAEVVCRAAGELEADVLDGMLSLVDKSLLRQQELAGGEPRFWMLQLLREFGMEALRQAGESEVIRQTHVEYFLALAEEAESELRGPDQVRWLERLEQEHDNLRAALTWTREQSEGEWGLRLAGALQLFWEIHGHLSEGRQWLETLLAREHPAAPAVRAKALRGAGVLERFQGDYSQARVLLKESLALYREQENKAGIANSLGQLGSLARFQGDYSQAKVLLEESLALFRELGDKFGIAWMLSNLGILARFQGDYSQARVLLEESLILRRKLGDKSGIAWMLSNLGILARFQGDYSQARVLLEESLSQYRELGDKDNSAWVLGELGILARFQGDYDQAKALLEESLAQLRELGDKADSAWMLSNLGILVRLQSDYDQAKAMLEESLSRFRELGDKDNCAWMLGQLGSLARLQGDYGQARVLLEESLSQSRELGDKADSAWELSELGILAQLLSDYDQARDLLEESLRLRRELGDKAGIASCLEGMAEGANIQGDPERAAWLFGAAEALRVAIGGPLPPVERASHEQAVATARAQLGEQAFAAAWQEGRTMPLDKIIDDLLKMEGKA